MSVGIFGWSFWGAVIQLRPKCRVIDPDTHPLILESRHDWSISAGLGWLKPYLDGAEVSFPTRRAASTRNRMEDQTS